jgi:hypothetical protein
MVFKVDIPEYIILHCRHCILHHVEEVFVGDLFDRTDENVTFVVHVLDNGDVVTKIGQFAALAVSSG